ncbi:MAG: Nif3-like dinuclear metal center hexameric protein [Phycisphaerae bacterium]
MVERRKIVSYLDELLKITEIKDSSCNGLQVEGENTIRKIGLAVDACLAVYQKAVESGCQMILVHHGLIWGGIKAIRGPHYRQIRYLMEHGLNLYGAHLPLDLHSEVGNNIELARLLKLRRIKPFGLYEGMMIGYTGALGKPVGVQRLSDQLQATLGGQSILLPFGKTKNQTVAIVSGGAGNELGEVVEKGIDCYVTGEPVHWNHHWALENRTNVIYLGHYHSEQLGVRAVGKKLEKRFKVETVFLDVPTAV